MTIDQKTTQRNVKSLNNAKLRNKISNNKIPNVKSEYKRARLEKERMGFTKNMNPIDLEKEVLRFEKTNGIPATIDDIVSIFSKHQISEPHSDNVVNENIDNSESFLFRIKNFLNTLNETSPEMSLYISIVEDIMMITYAVYKNTDIEILAIIVVSIIKRITGGSITESLTKYLVDIMDGFFCPEVKEPQSNTINDFIMNFKMLKSSQFTKKLHSLISLGVVCGFCNPININVKGIELYTNQGLNIAETATDFFTYVIDLVAYFFSTGYDFFLKDFSSLWTYDEVAQLDNDIIFLSANIQSIGLGDFEMRTGMTVLSYQDKLNSAYHTARYLANNTADRNYRSLMNMKLEKLSRMIIYLEQQTPLAGMREAPFSFCVFGSSSIGKSTLVNILILSVLKFNNYEHHDSNICILQSNDKFYSTYKANSTAVLLDDVANVKTDRAAANPCDMLISLVNNVMYYAPKAEAAEKGKILVQPKVVAVTTNVRDLKAFEWSNEPISVLRRLKYHLEVRVKPQYSKVGGKLDPNKITPQMLSDCEFNGVIDLWEIDIFEVTPAGHTTIGGAEDYSFTPVRYNNKEYLNVDIYETLMFFNKTSQAFYEQQRSLIKGNKDIGRRMRFDPDTGCILKPVLKEPQSFSLNKIVDITTDIIANSIYSKIIRTLEPIRPNLLEYFFINRTHKYAMKKLADKFCDDFLSPVHYVPHSMRRNKYFRLFYYYLNRKFIVAATLGCGIISSVLSFKITSSKMENRTLSTIVSLGTGLLFSGIAKKQAYDHIMDELDNQPLHNIMRNQKVVHAGNILFKTGITFTGGFLFIKVVKSLYRLMFAMPQGNLCPTTEEDILERDKESNVWKTQTIPYYSSNLFSRNMTASQLINKLEANCFHIIFEDEKRKATVGAIALKSNVFACPLHFFYEGNNIRGNLLEGTYTKNGLLKNKLNVKVKRCSSETGSFFGATIYLDSVERINNHDFCLFHLPSGGTLPDITHFFCDGYYSGPIQAVHRRQDGSVRHLYGSCMRSASSYKKSMWTRPIPIDGGNISYNDNTELGMCSAFIVSESNNPEIIGLHIAGVTNTREGSYLTLKNREIDKAISSLFSHNGNLEPHSESAFIPERYGVDISINDEVSPQSPVNYIKDFNYVIRGSIGQGATYHSNVVNTYISKTVEEQLGVVNTWGKPKFAPRRWKPWYDFLDVASKYETTINPALLKRAKDDYLKPLKIMMGKYTNKTNMTPLNLHETINGVPGMRFIDGLNFQTSIGFPLTGKKSGYLIGEPGHFKFRDERMFTDELDKMRECYIKSERYYPVFKACLKDEPTDVTKEKVRVFHAADITLSLAWRKYGLPVLRMLSIYPFMSECAVGINPFSDEWEQLHRHVTFDGLADDHIIAGDYSKWDIRLPPELITMAFQIIIELAECSGYYTPEDLQFLRGLATDTTYYVCHFNGTAIEMRGGVPSGHNLTAHINSIANSLLLRCGFFASGCNGNFRDVIHIMTYGDDFFGGLRDVKIKFNHIIYKDWLSTVGLVLTMPDKVQEAKPFLNIYECDFLKRKSIYCKHDGKHYGALDVKSLVRSLMVRGKIKVSKELHIYDVLRTFLREISYHDEDTYEYYRTQLRFICDKHKICNDFLRMDYLEYHYYRNHIDDESYTARDSGITTTISNGYPDNNEALEIECTNIMGGGCCSPLTDSEDECDSEKNLKRLDKQNKINGVITPGFQQDPDFATRNENYPSIDFTADELSSDLRWGDEFHFLKDNEPHSSATVFGNEPSELPAELETGTATMVTSSKDSHHNMDRVNKGLLGMRQDPSRTLEKYLERPVVVWNSNVNQNLNVFIPILDLFLNNVRIRDKIRGYAFLNAKLNVKVTVTASPLVSGSIHTALNLWANTDNGLGAMSNSTGLFLTHAQLSQLPNFLIDLASEQGGQISMPIITPNCGLNITQASQIVDCFTLYVRTLAPTRIPVGNFSIPHITVFAWLSEVSLVGTTLSSELVPQSSEYSKDNDLNPASTDTKFADSIKASLRSFEGKVSDMGVDALMHTLGMSQPIAQHGPIAVIPRSVTNMATYNSEQHIDNLAGDMKQEISIGTRDLGFEDYDHMSLDNILDRWGLFHSINVVTNDTNFNNTVYILDVTPLGCNTFTLGTQLNLSPIPVNVAALAFSRWRGTMIYRFHMVGSALMKGKLSIKHDVIGGFDAATYNSIDTQALNTVIWDLATTRTIEIEVPWASNLSFKPTGQLMDPLRISTSTTTKLLPREQANGCLIINEITPISDGSLDGVTFVMSAKAKKGMVFGDLRPVLAQYTFAGINNGTSGVPAPQSDEQIKMPYGVILDEAGDLILVVPTRESVAFFNKWILDKQKILQETIIIEDPEPQSFLHTKDLTEDLFSGQNPNTILRVNIAGIEQDTEDDDVLASVCMGEKYFNLRQIIKRYTMNFCRIIPFASQIDQYSLGVPDRPLMKGWQGNPGPNIDPNGRPCTYARDSFISFYSVCFLAYRGGFKHKVVTMSNTPSLPHQLTVSRKSPGYNESTTPLNNRTINGSASGILIRPDFRSGATLTHSAINGTVEYSTPYQSRAKVSWAMDRRPTVVKFSDDGGYDYTWHNIRILTSGNTGKYITMEKYIAAGDDFSLFFYKYAPTMVLESPGAYPQA